MKDNLESYFRKHLQDASGDKDDWSLPSDDVWENAVVQFPDEPTDKKLIYLWWVVGALILTLSLALFYISHLNGKVEQYALLAQKNETTPALSKDTKNEKNLKDNLAKTKDLNKNNHETEGSTSPKESKLNYKPIKNAALSKKKENTLSEKQNSTKIQSNLKDKIVQKDLDIKRVEKAQNLLLVNDREDRNIKSNSSHKDARSALLLNSDLGLLNKKRINPLPVLTLGLKSKVPDFYRELDPRKEEEMIISKKQPHFKHALNVFAGPSWTATPMDVIGNGNEDNLQGYNNLQTTISFGLNYRLTLSSHWYLTTGFGYQSIKSWSLSNQDMIYMAVDEFVDGQGIIVNDLRIPMPTPTGEVGTSIRMGQSIDNPILDGEHYNAIMDLNQVYRYLNIPLGIGYRHALGHKHNIQFEAAINYMKLLSQTNVLDASLIKSNDETAMRQMKMDLGDHPKLKAPIFSVSTSLAYQYNLFNNLSLDFTIGYFKTLNPLYSTSVAQTKAQGISASTGFTIKF